MIGRAELERRRAELLASIEVAASYRTQLLGLGMTEGQIHRVESNRKLSADYPIVAPKGGTVLKRDITVGQVVQPADPAFTIADLSSAWIVANVPEEDAGELQKNMTVSVRIPAIPEESVTRVSFVCFTDRRPRHPHGGGPHGRGERPALKPDELATMRLPATRITSLLCPTPPLCEKRTGITCLFRWHPHICAPGGFSWRGSG